METGFQNLGNGTRAAAARRNLRQLFYDIYLHVHANQRSIVENYGGRRG